MIDVQHTAPVEQSARTANVPTKVLVHKQNGPPSSAGHFSTRLFHNHFQRAGDRTRTGDVQLGKLSEANGVVS